MAAKTNPAPLAGGNRAGIGYAQQLSSSRKALERQFRRQRLVERVHRNGARVVFEFIDEIARHHPGIVEDLDQRLERYAAIDPETLAVLGGDQFPSRPLRLVGGAA
jgi:hypothetical protein